MRIGMLFLAGLSLFSCNQSPVVEDHIGRSDTLSTTVSTQDYKITQLLDRAAVTDTLEFRNEFQALDSFLFFKAGYILSKTEKHALVVNCSAEKTYDLKLYSMHNNRWGLSDHISGLEAFPVQFDAVFADYNFDGQTDMYIQVSESNGWPLSRGHLIIIDPETKRLDLHEETREFANMTPDLKTKTVKTESWNGCDLRGQIQLTVFTNKWVNGRLKTISQVERVVH